MRSDIVDNYVLWVTPFFFILLAPTTAGTTSLTNELLKTSAEVDHTSNQTKKNGVTQMTEEITGKTHSTSAGMTW